MKLSNAFLRGVNSGISLNRGSLLEKYLEILNNPAEKDCASLKGDWENVGGYIRKAIERYESQQ